MRKVKTVKNQSWFVFLFKSTQEHIHTHVSSSIIIKCNTNKIKVTLNEVLRENAQGQALTSVRVDRTLFMVVERLQTVNNCPTPTLGELFECVVWVRLLHRV